MKTLLIIIVLILLSNFSIEAQQSKKYANSKNKANKSLVDTTKNSTTNLDSCNIVNKDSCINPNSKDKCRMKDNFIDKDGDGINDNRCNGMGFGRQKRMGNCGKRK